MREWLGLNDFLIHNRPPSSPCELGRISSPTRGLFFGGFSMKWMLLLVLVVIGVGTLMGTTALPVL